MSIKKIYQVLALMLTLFYFGCAPECGCSNQQVCTTCEKLNSLCDCVPKLSCDHGTLDDFKCICECDSGWTGDQCNVQLTIPGGNGKYLTAEVAPSFSGKFTYHTTTVDFELRYGQGGSDTIVIDGYHGDDDWIYFEIYRDIASLNAPVAIPLEATQATGTAFGSYKDKNTGEIYHTDGIPTTDILFLETFSTNPLRMTGKFTHHMSYPFISETVVLNNGGFSSY